MRLGLLRSRQARSMRRRLASALQWDAQAAALLGRVLAAAAHGIDLLRQSGVIDDDDVVQPLIAAWAGPQQTEHAAADGGGGGGIGGGPPARLRTCIAAALSGLATVQAA